VKLAPAGVAILNLAKFSLLGCMASTDGGRTGGGDYSPSP
jgi:hypothetical protein